jgi:hypothetical protein
MKIKKNAVKILEKTDDRIKFECQFCKDGDPHMIVFMNKDGDIHVHAPLENRYLMNQFMETINEEQIKFNEKI